MEEGGELGSLSEQAERIQLEEERDYRTLVFSAYSLADKMWWLSALRDAAEVAATAGAASGDDSQG